MPMPRCTSWAMTRGTRWMPAPAANSRNERSAFRRSRSSVLWRKYCFTARRRPSTLTMYTRLLPPRAWLSTRTCGTHSTAATSRAIASVDMATKVLADFPPAADAQHAVDLRMMPIGIEQDALHAGGEGFREQDLGQVVDVVLAGARADARKLFFLGQLEEHVALVDQRAVMVQVPRDPAPRGLVQVMARPDKGMPGLVADDAHRDAALHRPPQEFDGARVGAHLVHACAVDRALHLGPHILATLPAQEITHGELALRRIDRHRALLHGDTVKNLVVADERVVEVNADAHACRPPR